MYIKQKKNNKFSICGNVSNYLINAGLGCFLDARLSGQGNQVADNDGRLEPPAHRLLRGELPV